MGLQEIYDHENTFAEARGEGEHGDENGALGTFSLRGGVHRTMHFRMVNSSMRAGYNSIPCG